MDYLSLLKNTSAYKIFCGDKRADRLSHAYLLVCADGDNLIEYLKLFAKVALCGYGDPCLNCRTCRLIENGLTEDVKIYPKNGETVLKDDVVEIIRESYIKPIEAEKKVFIINRAQTMNAAAQNKLLKTLEEPPKNVIIILGATSDTPLLSTVKSRVKRLEIQPFSEEVLFNALKEDCPDLKKLKDAVACGDGTLKKAYENYREEGLWELIDAVAETLNDMQSTKKLLEYSFKIQSLKKDIKEVLDAFRTLLKEMLAAKTGEDFVINRTAYQKVKDAKGFSEGALIYALDAVTEAENKIQFNTIDEQVLESLLFRILEGKYKWQKL